MKSLPILILLTALFVVYSCKSDKDRIAEIVEYWQGREIEFPEVMTDLLTGDTINLFNADYIVFTYIDSAGCVSCKMKLVQWKEFYNVIETKVEDNIIGLMIIHSDKKNEIIKNLKRVNYDKPVYIDSIGILNKLNSFPDEYEYQTFLLDKRRRVISIGNPIFIDGTAHLYESILTGEKTFNHSMTNEVVIKNNIIDVGVVKPNQKLNKVVNLRNEGTDTVYIRDTYNSCYCIESIVANKYLPPKQQLNVVLNINTDSIPGFFQHSVNLYYEDFDYPSIIRIVGEVSD